MYLQLKPRRRLRVIHLNCQGALPNPSPYYFQNSTNGGDDSDSDEEDYWFQNADPKRPKINQPPASQPPKRIFHKLEPQVRPTFEELSPSNLANIQGRLPRKTIKDVKENDDEEDDMEDHDNQGLKIKKNEESQSQSPSVKKEDLKEQLNESKEVLTLPEPGESSTDPDDTNDQIVQDDTTSATASIKEAGQKLGGYGNVAFESEEDDEYDNNDTPDTAIQSSHVISQKISENAQINQEPMHVLPAVFFIHGVGGSANVWANQLSFFASLGHEVIAPDLLGMM